MRAHEFIACLTNLDIDAQVFIEHTENGRLEVIEVERVEIDGDGDVIIYLE